MLRTVYNFSPTSVLQSKKIREQSLQIFLFGRTCLRHFPLAIFIMTLNDRWYYILPTFLLD